MAITNERIKRIADCIEPRLKHQDRPLFWFRGDIYLPSEAITVSIEFQKEHLEITFEPGLFAPFSFEEIEQDTVLQHVTLELIRRLRK